MSVMRRYYAPGVALFVGCAVTGVLWFDRPSGSITGEDVAELYAAAWERAAIPGLLGESVPDTGRDTVTTDVVTNFVVEVELEHLGGYSAYSASPRTLYFYTTNWAVPQAVTVTPAGRPDEVPEEEGRERVRVRYSEGPSSSLVVGEFLGVLVYPAGYSPANTAASSESGHGVTVTPGLLGVGDSPGYGTFTVTLSSPPAHKVDSVEEAVRTNRTAWADVGPYYYIAPYYDTGAGYILGSGFYDAANAARLLLSYLYDGEGSPKWVRSSDVDGWGSQEWTADYGTAPLTVTPSGSPHNAGGSLSKIFAPYSYSLFDTAEVHWTGWDGWCSDVFPYLSAISSVDAAFTPRETSTAAFGWATEDSLFLPADGLWCAAFGPKEYKLGWYGDVYGFRTNRGVFAGGTYVYGPHVRDFFGSLSEYGTTLVAADPGVYAGGSLWAAAGYSATNLYQWDGFERLGTNSYGERAAIPKRYPGTNEASQVRDLLSRLDCSYRVSRPVLRGYTVVRERDEEDGTVSRVTNDTVGAYWTFEGSMSRMYGSYSSVHTYYAFYDPPYTLEPVTVDRTETYSHEFSLTNRWRSKAETGFVTNIVLTWPSRYAVESGYVSRVRVYGIFRQYEWNDALAPGSGGSTNFFLSEPPGVYVPRTRSSEYSWTHHRGDPPSCVLYASLATGAPLFGFPAVFRLSHDVPPSGVTYDAAARVHGGSAYVPAVASVIRPVLLDGDVDLSSWPLLAKSPVPSRAEPAYEWVPAGGFDTVTMDGEGTFYGDPVGHYSNTEPPEYMYEWGYEDSVWTGTAVGQYYAYSFSLVLEEIITVVDWNWKHLSDSAAAEPGFVPEWVESNTKSPLAP